MTSTAAPQRHDFVPLAARMRYLLLYRMLGSSIALAAWWLLPHIRVVEYGAVAVMTAAYLIVSVLGQLLWQALRRRAHALFGGMLLLDGVWLALMIYATGGGVGSPLRALVLVHLVVVCLLASFRTGVKLALWHSLLAIGIFHAQEAGVFESSRTGPVSLGDDEFRELLISTAMLWLLTLTTATFSAVNERELRRRRYDLEALARLAFTLEATTDPAAVSDALVRSVVDEFDLGRALVVGTEQGGGLRLLAQHGGAASVPAAATVRPGSVLAGTESGTRLIKRLDPEVDAWLDELLPAARNVIVVPLYAEGRTIGVLVGEHGGGRGARVDRRVVSMIERFASQSALALNNAWLLQRVQRLAASDGLTGVANRRSLEDGLARELLRAARSGRSLSLVMLDIDHFKQLNDRHGHQAGDAALKRVARQLSETCRAGDLVARYGGEEFAILLPETGVHDALALAERLRLVVAGERDDISLTASLGVATYPDHARDLAGLVQAADEALYESKGAGRNRTSAAGAAAASG